MRKLEEKYEDRIAVVGVHSGKYTAERVTPNIRDAALRLDAVHPTINDRQFRVWRSYAVRAWPTLVAVDPRGYVVGMHAGEFSADDLMPFIERVLGESAAAGTLRSEPLTFAAESPTHEPTALRFPGKVAVDGDRLAIADSGNGRVILARLEANGTRARVERTVRDFVNPQGLAFHGDALFVCDPGAHSIVAVSLETGASRRLAGIDRQARTSSDLDAGAMSSPWDLVVHGKSLFVAMAGIHQLWKVDIETGAGVVHAGSGAEELHDAPLAMAALAQPMGIALDGDALVFCDSESSAIRTAGLELADSVQTVAGTGLFDFGDVDGTGDEVRLQHPQGITRLPDGRLLIADSYNGALKWVDRTSRTVRTWLRGLEEPEGLAASSTHVYIADTNAHRIMVAGIDSAHMQPLELEGDA